MILLIASAVLILLYKLDEFCVVFLNKLCVQVFLLNYYRVQRNNKAWLAFILYHDFTHIELALCTCDCNKTKQKIF